MSQVTTQTNNYSWPIRKQSSNFPPSSGVHYNLHIFECYTSSIIYSTGHFSLSEGRCSRNTFEAFHGELEGSVESDTPNTRPQNPRRVAKVFLHYIFFKFQNKNLTKVEGIRIGIFSGWKEIHFPPPQLKVSGEILTVKFFTWMRRSLRFSE
jgi:hypothetical protein